MKQHYNLPDESFVKLLEEITVTDMMDAIPLFTVAGKLGSTSLADFEHTAQVTKVSLMYYVDHKGDFTDNDYTKVPSHQKLAMAVFQSLETSEQMQVLEYISHELGDEEDAD
jgi:hypothetical protein